MKSNLKHGWKNKATEETFSALLVILVLLVLPTFGGTAMLVGAAVGFALQVYLFPDRFRSHNGSLTAALSLVAALLVAAAAAVAVALVAGH